MNSIGLSPPRWLKKSGVFLLFFVVETMVFAIIPFSPYLSKNTLLCFHAGLTATLLVLALFLRRSERGGRYWSICYVFFVAGAAVLLSVVFADDLMKLFGLTVTTPQGIAVAKFSESILRVVPILALMPMMDFEWRSMYLNKGRIGIGLTVGIVAFIIFPILAYMPLANQEGVLSKLLSLSPWILLFLLSNGFMEELLFRGLFLKRYEPFPGKGLSNLLLDFLERWGGTELSPLEVEVLERGLTTFPCERPAPPYQEEQKLVVSPLVGWATLALLHRFWAVGLVLGLGVGALIVWRVQARGRHG